MAGDGVRHIQNGARGGVQVISRYMDLTKKDRVADPDPVFEIRSDPDSII